MGNVGDDPKVNQINNDLKVARFPLATNELYLDKDGNHIRKIQRHTIVVWNKIAGITGEYVKKGDPLYVEGCRLKFFVIVFQNILILLISSQRK